MRVTCATDGGELEIQQSSSEDVYFLSNSLPSPALNIDVAPTTGSTNTGGSGTPGSSSQITGQAVDSSDAPINGLPVRLYGPGTGSGSLIAEATTVDSGNFSFAPNGTVSSFRISFGPADAPWTVDPDSGSAPTSWDANNRPPNFKYIVAQPETIPAAGTGDSVVVKGVLEYIDGSALESGASNQPDVRIQVYEISMASSVLKATATSDANGEYSATINVTGTSLNIQVVAEGQFDGAWEEITERATIYRCKTTEVVNPTTADDRFRTWSYAEATDAVQDTIGTTNPATVTEAQIDMLASTLRLQRKHVKHRVEAMVLKEAVEEIDGVTLELIDIHVYFALLCKGFPMNTRPFAKMASIRNDAESAIRGAVTDKILVYDWVTDPTLT